MLRIIGASAKSLLRGFNRRVGLSPKMADQSERSMRETIAKTISLAKTSHPWERDKPYDQPYYSYEDILGRWRQVLPEREESTATASRSGFNFHLLTWNIDMMAPFSEYRMQIAIKYLTNLCKTKYSGLLVITFQEMLVTDLELLQASPYVQSRFYMSDVSDEHWEGGYYGTCTLVDKRFSIKRCMRVHYEATRMERDALFVDIALNDNDNTIRVVNTHLESLVADPPLRPLQLSVAAREMKASPSVSGAILAGDLNAIQPFDRSIASENGLKDVFLELGGKEDTDAGFTWGPLVPRPLRDRFGSSRMDKVLYYGDAIHAEGLEKIGSDAEVDRKRERESMLEWGQCVEDVDGQKHVYVTDHIGLVARFAVASGA